MDTIFALSSGAPPAAVAVIRISGPAAGEALRTLIGKLPPPRRAVLADIVDPRDKSLIDRTLVLWLPGPGTATGEDSVELHLHGGRALVRACEAALASLPGLRLAEPGEFTRRAFAHGRIDLAEAEGLADLIEAETELQRRNARDIAGGRLSRHADSWRDEILRLSALAESRIDFSDEDDVVAPDSTIRDGCAALAEELAGWLARPPAERLRDGFHVVLAGPPNSGKSTLFNALVEHEAAITSPIAGTTRDVLERSVAIEGVPLRFSDTAGLREDAGDDIEQIGIVRALATLDEADLVLWLGPVDERPAGALDIAAQCDREDRGWFKPDALRVSAVTGEGLDDLRGVILERARTALPKPGELALNLRQREALAEARDELGRAAIQPDELLVAENLRLARRALDRLLGRTDTEALLDAIFGRFCIGK